MTLAEIKQMHGEELYDRDGNLVGRWNGERGMFSDCFVVRERMCYVVDTTLQDWRGGLETYAYNLSCGHTCTKSWPEQPRYCDECGARVVDE